VFVPPSCLVPVVTTTTTTVPPTTTTTTTTVPPTTTTQPPVTAGFIETFTGGTGLERFDTGIYHRGDLADGTITWPLAEPTWHGDHDLQCGSPDTTFRIIHRNVKAESFYVCRDHLMTSIGDTDGYSTGWFSPKQTFTTERRVAWDVNLTDLGGRQWWEVSIVPTSFNSGVATCPHCSADPALASVAGLPAHPAGSVVVATLGRGVNVYTNGVNRDVAQFYTIANFDPIAAASKAIRRPFVVTDNGDGTITVEFGGFASYTVPGSFPAGGFTVEFKDHNYTPDKDGPVAGYTWHWDSISVT